MEHKGEDANLNNEGHAEAILELLDQVRCIRCGGQAVRGARICLACARSLPAVDLAREAAAPSPVVSDAEPREPEAAAG